MKKRMKAVLACILVFVLTISNFSGINLVNNVEEAKAEEELQKITWTDFGYENNTIYEGTASRWESCKSLTSGVNNKEFEGDIILAYDAELRYGGINWIQGLGIMVNSEGSLVLTDHTSGEAKAFVSAEQASTYGLSQFADQQFTVKIRIENYVATVYINGIQLGDSFEMTKSNVGTYCSPGFGKVVIRPTMPSNVKKITWKDFGVEYEKSYIKPNDENGYESYRYYNADTLDATVFEGDIQINKGSEFLYAGELPNQGMSFKINEDGDLILGTQILSGLDKTISASQASEYGLTSFSDRFTLKIMMTGVLKASADVAIWINGFFLHTFTLKGYDGLNIGKAMCVCASGTSVTPYEVPLKRISWEDFSGMKFGSTYAGAAGANNYDNMRSFSYGQSLNNTCFEGDISMPANGGFRYATSTGGHGFTIGVDGDGNLLVGSQTMIINGVSDVPHAKYTYSADKFKLKTFIKTRFTLRIEMREVEKTSARATIYVNDSKVDDFELTSWSNASQVHFEVGQAISFGAPGAFNDNNWVGGGTIYESSNVLTEISWKDFGLQSGTVYTAVKGEEYNSAKKLEGKDTLDNTEFSGDIIFEDNSTILYASCGVGTTQSWLSGLKIGVSNGTFFVDANYFDLEDKISISPDLAANYNVTSFVGQRLTLRIRMTKMTSDEATLSIWLNGKAIIEQSHLTKQDDTNATYKFKLGSNIFSLDGSVMVYKASEVLTPISWSDFGFEKGTVYNDTDPWVHTKAVTGLEGLNNTEFVGEIIFSDESGIRYIAQDHNVGIEIGVKDGAFRIGANGFKIDEVSIPSDDASKYGIGEFANTRFTLKIQTREVTTTSAIVDVYVNNILVEKPIVVLANGFTLGNQLNACYLGSVTIPNEDVKIPTNLTALSWEEFGYGAQTYDLRSDAKTRANTGLETLNNTLFTGELSMIAGAELRYGDTEASSGAYVSLKNDSDGSLTVAIKNETDTLKSYTLTPAYYGLTSFVGQKFKVQISMQNIDKDDAKIGIWINGCFIDDWFTGEVAKQNFGTNIRLMKGANITLYSMRNTTPIGLTKIHFSDWNEGIINEGKITTSSAPELKLSCIGGEHPTLGTLVNTSLTQTMTFHDEVEKGIHQLQYGQTEDAVPGLMMKLTSETDMMVLWHFGTIDYDYVFNISAASVGLEKFNETEFTWQIDIEQVNNNILVYLSFNDILYNQAPIVIYNVANTMSNKIAYTTFDQNLGESLEAYKDRQLKSYILTASMKELPVLYHDLAMNDSYTIAGEVKAVRKRSTVGGGYEEITGFTNTLKDVGDYMIIFHDGVSEYKQNVVLFRAASKASDMVRTLKLAKDATLKGKYMQTDVRTCDADYSGAVDKEDVTVVRKKIVGAYISKMEISGFHDPQDKLIEEDVYKALREAGITKIINTESKFSDDASSRFKTYKGIALAQKYGMTVLLQDKNLIEKAKANPKSITEETVKKAIAPYENYQAFGGLFVVDEPKSETYTPKVNNQPWPDYIDDYTTLFTEGKKVTAANGRTLEMWTNAYSIPDNQYNYEKHKYEFNEYVNELVSKLGLTFVTATNYPFNRGKTGDDVEKNAAQFFWQLAIEKHAAEVQEKKSDEKVDLRGFVQNGEGFVSNTANQPIKCTYTEGEYLWNANMLLAFGVKELEYFPLMKPADFVDYDDKTAASGLLDTDGNKTKWYDYAVKVNKQASAAGAILKDATNKGYMATAGANSRKSLAQKTATDVLDEIKLYNRKYASGNPDVTIKNKIHTDGYAGATVSSNDTEYGAFIGCYEYGSQNALYIANYNTEKNNIITVNLDSNKEVTVIYNGETTVMTANQVIQDLSAGEAVLVVY